MSGRSVADIVAADSIKVIDHLDGELKRLDALRPPCPTCDGEGYVLDAAETRASDCPDCTDGRMSWERMAAIVTAVFRYEDDQLPTTVDACRDYLRSVRP